MVSPFKAAGRAEPLSSSGSRRKSGMMMKGKTLEELEAMRIDLCSRRELIEQRSRLRETTEGQFEIVRQKSVDNRRRAYQRQLAAARYRNEKLLKEAKMAEVEGRHLDGSSRADALKKAQDRFMVEVEKLLPAWQAYMLQAYAHKMEHMEKEQIEINKRREVAIEAFEKEQAVHKILQRKRQEVTVAQVLERNEELERQMRRTHLDNQVHEVDRVILEEGLRSLTASATSSPLRDRGGGGGAKGGGLQETINRLRQVLSPPRSSGGRSRRRGGTRGRREEEDEEDEIFFSCRPGAEAEEEEEEDHRGKGHHDEDDEEYVKQLHNRAMALQQQHAHTKRLEARWLSEQIALGAAEVARTSYTSPKDKALLEGIGLLMQHNKEGMGTKHPGGEGGEEGAATRGGHDDGDDLPPPPPPPIKDNPYLVGGVGDASSLLAAVKRLEALEKEAANRKSRDDRAAAAATAGGRVSPPSPLPSAVHRIDPDSGEGGSRRTSTTTAAAGPLQHHHHPAEERRRQSAHHKQQNHSQASSPPPPSSAALPSIPQQPEAEKAPLDHPQHHQQQHNHSGGHHPHQEGGEGGGGRRASSSTETTSKQQQQHHQEQEYNQTPAMGTSLPSSSVKGPGGRQKQQQQQAEEEEPEEQEEFSSTSSKTEYDHRPDIRDLTPSQRLLLLQKLSDAITTHHQSHGGAGPPPPPRFGYPAKWDGQTGGDVLSVERDLIADTHLLVEQPAGSDRKAWALPRVRGGGLRQEEAAALVVLHVVRWSARELLPLELLNGLIDEDKVSKFHRRSTRAQDLWQALLKHLRDLAAPPPPPSSSAGSNPRQRAPPGMTAAELTASFGEALVGDMSKRQRGDEQRYRRKVASLIESVVAGAAKYAAQQRGKQQQQEKEEQEDEDVSDSLFSSLGGGLLLSRSGSQGAGSGGGGGGGGDVLLFTGSVGGGTRARGHEKVDMSRSSSLLMGSGSLKLSGTTMGQLLEEDIMGGAEHDVLDVTTSSIASSSTRGSNNNTPKARQQASSSNNNSNPGGSKGGGQQQQQQQPRRHMASQPSTGSVVSTASSTSSGGLIY